MFTIFALNSDWFVNIIDPNPDLKSAAILRELTATVKEKCRLGNGNKNRNIFFKTESIEKIKDITNVERMSHLTK